MVDMTELELYKFVKENNIEWHECDNKGNTDIIMFVNDFIVEDFNEILSTSIFDDEGISCTMKQGYFCFWMNEICEYYDIDPKNIFY